MKIIIITKPTNKQSSNKKKFLISQTKAKKKKRFLKIYRYVLKTTHAMTVIEKIVVKLEYDLIVFSS